MREKPAATRRRLLFYGWWFLCIGVGFALLGVRSYIEGDLLWLTILRFVISAGFSVLGVGWLRQSKRAPR